MRLKTKISHLAIVLLVALNASPVFAITNKAAMCAPERRCTAGSPCGDGATCDTSERLRSFGVCNLTAPNEGRCITPAQQSCLPDDFCLGQDTAVLPPAPVAPTICCQCVRNSQNSCVQFSDITSCGQYAQSQSYQTFNNSNASAMQGVTCSRVLSATECRTVANGGVCGSNPGIVSDVYAPVAPPVPAAPPRDAIIPQLGVSIPGLKFSAPTENGGQVSNSFLAQYVAAIYRYGVQISVFVAIIMVIYGGFRYLIGSGAGDVKRGRQIINDALLGMILVLGGYVLLYTVNPATVNPTNISLETIDPLIIVAESQLATRVDTVAPGTDASTAGSHTSPFPNCPLTLTGTARLSHDAQNIWQDPRTVEFFQQVGTIVNGTTPSQRILQVADAAAQCGVSLDACGATAGAIWALAGVGPLGPSCINQSSRGAHRCWTQEQNRSFTLRELPRDVSIPALKLRCGGHEPCPQAVSTNRNYDPHFYDGCSASAGETITRFVSLAANSADSRMLGYPDSWADLLQPGDIVTVFNGNDSCGASHAWIFMGWAAGGISAQVVQGANGRLVSRGTICVKRACGARLLPIMRIYRPQ